MGSVNDKDRVEAGIQLARDLIERIDSAISKAGVSEDQLLLSKEFFERIQLKLGKTESGYTLLEIWKQ